MACHLPNGYGLHLWELGKYSDPWVQAKPYLLGPSVSSIAAERRYSRGWVQIPRRGLVIVWEKIFVPLLFKHSSLIPPLDSLPCL